MKKTILKFLVIALMAQSQAFHAQAQQAEGAPKFRQSDLINMDRLQDLVDSGKLTEDQYEDYMDLIESGGDTADVKVTEPREMTPEIEAVLNETTKDIGTATSVEELQKHADKEVAGHGQWGFHFVYIGKDGTRKELTSKSKHEKIRPASTMKLFSSNLAFDRKSYPTSSLGTLLQKSKNGMADAALRSVSKQKPDYRVPEGSYLRSEGLMSYRMRDSTEGKSQIIDTHILRGCSMMITEYSGLDDSSKFHPVNGSGLQQTDKDTELQTNTVTPRLETALLERILSNKTKYDKYKMLLTSPGRAGGTLYTHFKAGRKVAKIYAKTGTLGNGKGLAGFAETSKGVLVFSILGDRLKGMGPKEALNGPIENIVYNHISFLKNKGL